MILDHLKIYLAAWYDDAALMREWRDALRADGHVVTSRWIDGGHVGHVEDYKVFAREDVDDLYAADVMLLHHPRERHGKGFGGRHVETGIAIARGTPIVLVGDRENVFHHLDGVTVVPDFDAAKRALWRAITTEA